MKKIVNQTPKKIVSFKGNMTTPVKFAYANMKDKIRFRSSYGSDGNVSSIEIKGIKNMVYASSAGADNFKTFVDEHPRCTLGELKKIVDGGNYPSELKEIVNLFCTNREAWRVPIVYLDTDKM